MRKCFCHAWPEIIALQWVWIGETYSYNEDKEKKQIGIYHRGLECYEVIGVEDFRKYFVRL